MPAFSFLVRKASKGFAGPDAAAAGDAAAGDAVAAGLAGGAVRAFLPLSPPSLAAAWAGDAICAVAALRFFSLAGDGVAADGVRAALRRACQHEGLECLGNRPKLSRKKGAAHDHLLLLLHELLLLA